MAKKNYPAFQKVAHNIKRIKEQAKRETPITFAVTYTAPYAAKIHEDLEMPHPRGGQAKFLEQPLREKGPQYTAKVKALLQKKVPLKKALLQVGNELLEESQKLVPVLTGTLLNSGIVKLV